MYLTVTITQLFDVGQEECSVLFLWTYMVAAIAFTFWSTVYMWILTWNSVRVRVLGWEIKWRKIARHPREVTTAVNTKLSKLSVDLISRDTNIISSKDSVEANYAVRVDNIFRPNDVCMCNSCKHVGCIGLFQKKKINNCDY